MTPEQIIKELNTLNFADFYLHEFKGWQGPKPSFEYKFEYEDVVDDYTAIVISVGEYFFRNMCPYDSWGGNEFHRDLGWEQVKPVTISRIQYALVEEEDKMTTNPEEILEALNTLNVEVNDGNVPEDVDDLTYLLSYRKVSYKDVEFKVVDEYGGEGQGEQLWVVVSYGDLFFRIDGYYESWEGRHWDYAKWEQVFPHEKTIVEYR